MFVATLVSSSPVQNPDRVYRNSKCVVVGFVCLYGVVVVVCVFRVLYAIFSGSADDINKLLLALGGVIGGPFLIWRTLIAYQQTSISREGHYTSLFTRAVEQLGATREVQRLELDKTTDPNTTYSVTETEPNLEVRLGAIYALERITHDSERDHWPIMEVLCAYIRNPQNSRAPTTSTEIKKIGKWPASIPAPRSEVQAAITTIGRRPDQRISFEKSKEYYLDFSNTNLQSTNFFHLKFPGAQFSSAHLENSQMQRSDLSGSRFVLAKLNGTNFSLSNIEGADFTIAEADEAIFLGVSAIKASFSGTKLNSAIFSNAILDEAFFSGAILNRANFENAFLSNTVFVKAELVGANFNGAMFEAKRENPYSFKSVFDGAILFDANFSSSSGLTTAHFEGSVGDMSVKLPPAVPRPTTWAPKYLDSMERIDAKYSEIK